MVVPLDRKSFVPLYVQIKQQLMLMLGKQQDRDRRVFTDEELAKLFGVSRMTVRQAVQDLVDEGLVYRVRGLGTFLSSPKVSDSLERLQNFFQDWPLQGKSVSTELLDFVHVEASASVAQRLNLPEGTKVLYVSRLWHADALPIGVHHFYVHPSVDHLLSRTDLEHEHMYTAITQQLGLPLIGEQVEIEAAVADKATAARLQLRTGDPVLVRRLTQFYGQNEPLVTAKCLYRGDLYKYSTFIPAQPRPAGAASAPQADIRRGNSLTSDGSVSGGEKDGLAL